MLQVGQSAPSFSLPDQNGNPVALADLRGRWVVLYFYPKDDTPGCTVEACEFTAALPDFRGLDAEVFGCSADGSDAHLKFIAKFSLGIRLLTDTDKSVMTAYGAYGPKLLYGKQVEGVIRSTVLIAPDGTVAHHWQTVKAAGHAEQVRSKLAELRGGAVPATPVVPSDVAPAAQIVELPTAPVMTVPVPKAAAAKKAAPKKVAVAKAAPKKAAKKGTKIGTKKATPKKPAKQVAPKKAAKKVAKAAPRKGGKKVTKLAPKRGSKATKKATKKAPKKAPKKVTKKVTKKARR